MIRNNNHVSSCAIVKQFFFVSRNFIQKLHKDAMIYGIDFAMDIT